MAPHNVNYRNLDEIPVEKVKKRNGDRSFFKSKAQKESEKYRGKKSWLENQIQNILIDIMSMRRKIEAAEKDTVNKHRAEDKQTQNKLQREAITKYKEVQQIEFFDHYNQMIAEWQKAGMTREQFERAINEYIKTLNKAPKAEPPGKQIADLEAKIREIEGKISALRNKR